MLGWCLAPAMAVTSAMPNRNFIANLIGADCLRSHSFLAVLVCPVVDGYNSLPEPSSFFGAELQQWPRKRNGQEYNAELQVANLSHRFRSDEST